MNTYWAVFLLVVASTAARESHQNIFRDQALSFDDDLALYHPGRYLIKRSLSDGEVLKQDISTEEDKSEDETALLRTRRSLGILAGIRDRLIRDLKYEFLRIVGLIQKWIDSRIANDNSIFDLLSFASEMNSRYFKDIADIAADALDEIGQTLIDLGREFTNRLRDFIFNVPPHQKRPLYRKMAVTDDNVL